MDAVKNTVVDISLILLYLIEGIILWFIPKRLRYKDITGEVVLITGAGNGIGRELSLEFANHGAHLILLDIDTKGLEETRALVARKAEKNVNVSIYQCNVSNRNEIYSVAANIKDEIGNVTILVNNAGVITGKKFLDCPDDIIQKTMDVNIMAHFWACKAFLPAMKSANHGHIVFVSSIAGFMGSPSMTDYCASKYAVVGFEETLRLELEHEGYTGVKTTLVAPSFVTTGLFEGFHFWLIQPLTAKKVAKDVIAGVLVDQEIVMIPSWSLHFFLMLKLIFPRKAYRQLSDTLNFTRCMDNFQGRQKAN